MAYKLLALDVDGTLLTGEKVISPAVKEAVRLATQRGVVVMLATGRMYRAMLPMQTELGLDSPCICGGGGQVVIDNEVVYECAIQPGLTRALLNWLHVRDMQGIVFRGREFCYETHTEYIDEFVVHLGYTGRMMPDLRTRDDLSTPKILILNEPERISQIAPLINEAFAGRLCATPSRPRYLEVNRPETSKGVALAFVCERLGIDPQECIAVGDAETDMPMMQYAGMGVALANADALTLAEADYIAPSNDEDGVAHVIEKFILGGESL